MSDEIEHPFKPGTEVYRISGRDLRDYKLTKVDKLYKTGHFTLVGLPQRFRASRSTWQHGQGRWSAHKTGSGRYDYVSVELYDDISRKEAAEVESAIRHRVRCREIAHWLDRPERVSRAFSEKLCEQIAASALAQFGEPSP